jgi:hypothetical protein
MYRQLGNGVQREDGTFIPQDPRNVDWIKYQQWLAEGNEPEVPSNPSLSLSERKEQVKQEVDFFAASLRNRITANISPAEMASWTEKERQARAFLESNSPTDAPLLNLEASVREIALAALANMVIAKADNLKTMEAYIAGICGKHRDAIDQITSVEAVAAYDWRQGWP